MDNLRVTKYLDERTLFSVTESSTYCWAVPSITRRSLASGRVVG